jgi:radical SAM superfamily enzyme YgiQ (UPF0313 family)
MICEPLELEYAAAALKRDGHEVHLIDMLLERKPFQSFLHRPYDMVCFTSYINLVGIVKSYAETVRRFCPRALTVVGGVHAEVVPQDFVHGAIDKILFANAVETLCSLAKGAEDPDGAYSAGKARPKQNPHPDVWPDRSITKKYRSFYNYIYHEKCATIKTSLGCPYRCTFCFCTQVCAYAERPLKDVIEELLLIEEENIFIVDDDFLFSRKRLEEFCGLLDEHGISKHYIAFGRADFIAENEDIILLLRDHGFEAFFVGLESFRETDLAGFEKRTTVEMNRKAVRILEGNGLHCYSGWITGEDWGKEDFDTLIAHLNSFKHPFVNVQPITPMPGTPLFAEYPHELAIRRENHALWDMAHIVFEPQNMSRRRYYYHLLRVYLKTSASAAGRRYVRERYGARTYRRVGLGALKICLQYVRLIIKPA